MTKFLKLLFLTILCSLSFNCSSEDNPEAELTVPNWLKGEWINIEFEEISLTVTDNDIKYNTPTGSLSINNECEQALNKNRICDVSTSNDNEYTIIIDSRGYRFLKKSDSELYFNGAGRFLLTNE